MTRAMRSGDDGCHKPRVRRRASRFFRAQSLLSTLLRRRLSAGAATCGNSGIEADMWRWSCRCAGGRKICGRFLPLLRAQQYGAIASSPASRAQEDPAFALLRAAQMEAGAPLETIVAGLAVNTGQKVWNQLAALERLRPEDDIVAFIDADTLPTPLWLPRLVAVIVNSGRPVATGYRWMTPADERWSSCCLAAANASIAALPRGVLPMTIVWGGSVAMKRHTLEAIAIKDVWRGAISDDVQMAEALRRCGLTAHAPRQGLLLTPVACSWRELIAFGVRQYRIVYLHQPGSWAIALVFLWAPPVYLALAAPTLRRGIAGSMACACANPGAGRSSHPAAARHSARALARAPRTARRSAVAGRALAPPGLAPDPRALRSRGAAFANDRMGWRSLPGRGAAEGSGGGSQGPLLTPRRSRFSGRSSP